MAWLRTESQKAEELPRETWQTQLAVPEQGEAEEPGCLVGGSPQQAGSDTTHGKKETSCCPRPLDLLLERLYLITYIFQELFLSKCIWTIFGGR